MKAGAGALSPFIAHSDESGQCNMALLPSPRLMRDHVLDLQHRSRHDTPASPNWFTPEFFLYYFILLVALYSIFFSAYSFSQGTVAFIEIEAFHHTWLSRGPPCLSSLQASAIPRMASWKALG